MTDAHANPDPSSQPRRRRRWLGYLVAGVVGAAIGAGGLGFAAKRAVHMGWRDDARFERFVDHRLEHMLDEIDATEAQRSEVKTALLGAAQDMRALMQDMHGERDAFVAVLTGPQINRESIETLRAEIFAALERTSRRAVAALAEAAEALTPAQRAELKERFERHGRWRR